MAKDISPAVDDDFRIKESNIDFSTKNDGGRERKTNRFRKRKRSISYPFEDRAKKNARTAGKSLLHNMGPF